MSKLNLAITRIGDLLLRNTVTADNEGKPISNISLHIPPYQRPYKWSAKNTNQLLDDIILAQSEHKEVYRVGTLILHKNTDVSDCRYDIVDGQQRTVSFALMLNCFGRENIPFLNEKICNDAYSENNIRKNFRSLSRRIDGFFKIENGERILTEGGKSLIDYIENNCEFIVVITDDLSEAFQFFDSQNARGKKLYPHDLLKAYHLREMTVLDLSETKKTVKMWEDLNQRKLSELFNDYLNCVKAWIQGNRAVELDESNLDIFKGITAKDNYPYAQFYKSAFAYSNDTNNSLLPFVTGMQRLSSFQINAPVIAGKPFFEYAKHYYNILSDIQDNDKYKGYYINDNEIIKTLNLREWRSGVGNKITRQLLDTAILLYIDRFCHDKPSAEDTDFLNQFFCYAFIWAYSMRAQYKNVGWLVAQNYILGESNIINSFNIYKLIAEASSPVYLLSILSDRLLPLSTKEFTDKSKGGKDGDTDAVDENGIYKFYTHYFKELGFWRES